MPSAPEPVEFTVPAEVDEAPIIERLRRRFDVQPAGTAKFDRGYVDTFDGRLYRAGLDGWVEGPAGPLVVDDRRGRVRSGAVRPDRPDRRGRIFMSDLADGDVRRDLSAVVEMRALLPKVRVRGQLRRSVLCNGDGKTVVRLTIESATAVANRRLGTRLRLVGVLGYDQDLARAVQILERAGLSRPESTLVEEAAGAIGSPVAGCSSKLDVTVQWEQPAAAALVVVCRRLADITEANLPGVLDDIDTEFLHDLRVAVRRTRSVLKELKGVLLPDDQARARADLRWIQEITGPTRDLDVQLLDWPDMIAATGMVDDWVPLRDVLARHRAAAFGAMRRALTGGRYATAWARWRDLLAEPGSAGGEGAGPNAAVPAGRLVAQRIRSVYGGMVEMGEAIDTDSPPEALHDLRKRGKELRYLLELFGGMWPRNQVNPLVSALKGLQDVLGRFQDDQIQSSFLRGLGPELANRPGGADLLMALGVVIDHLSTDQRAARDDFARRFGAFAAPANRAVVRETFAGDRARRRRVTVS